MIYSSLTDIIGHTPLLEISGLEGQKARLIVKLESFNPGGSVKDRAALAMIEDAERRGILLRGATVIEPTSGNTGIGLAWVGIAKGYRIILTMPDTMSVERQQLLRAYGAEIVLTPGVQGMQGSINKANELRDTIPGAVILGQFDNPANPAVHERTTAQEIWYDTEGKIDVFVAGVGTGGTISGTAKALKQHNENIKIVAVEPQASPVLSKGVAGSHRIQGIGAGFVPKNYHSQFIDQIVSVSDQQAISAIRLLAKKHGLLVGISSGAAFSAAWDLAREQQYADKMIVVLLPDTGERYLSTGVFD